MDRELCKIFIGYAREDKSYLKELKKRLKVFENNKLATVWSDEEIDFGSYWEEEIMNFLREADITLFLVSADALASDFLFGREILKAIERHNRNETIIIPIIIRACDWQLTPLGALQALPPNAEPIASYSDVDKAWNLVSLGILKMIQQLLIKNNAENTNFTDREIKNNDSNKEEPVKAIIEEIAFQDPFEHEMTFVQGGGFLMGFEGYSNESPQHSVKVQDFYISKFPVTQKQWNVVMRNFLENPSLFKSDENLPVDGVSWKMAQSFIKQLNELTGKFYRLPSEAEWEFAAKGGTFSKGFLYAGSDRLEEVGWFKKNSDGRTQSVGKKKPNELSIFDMSGNIWEWCEDYWHENYIDAPVNGSARTSRSNNNHRVLRGGSWENTEVFCRITSRIGYSPVHDMNNVGFRLVHV